MGRSKVNSLCRSLARRYKVEDREDVHIMQIRRPMEFSAYLLWNVPHITSMEPGFLVATLQVCRCDSHLLCRLISVNVWVLRVNVTLLCKHGVSNVLSWPIIPDMFSCAAIDLKWRKFPWVTHGNVLSHQNPWDTHGSLLSHYSWLKLPWYTMPFYFSWDHFKSSH